MQTFTKFEKDDKKLQASTMSRYESDDIKIIDYNGKELIHSSDQIVLLPYFRDEGFILLHHEVNLNYNFKLKNQMDYKNITEYLTVIKCKLKKNDSPIVIVREFLHQNGVVLNSMSPIEVEKVLFRDPSQDGQFHICILDLKYNDYKFIQTENPSKLVKIELGYIDDIKSYDVITAYMLLKLKNDLKI